MMSNFSKEEELLRTEVMNRIDISKDTSDDELYSIIDSVVLSYSHKNYLGLSEQLKLRNQIFHYIRGFDILDEIFKDNQITEIMINGFDHIFIEKNGHIYPYQGAFSSKEKYLDTIQQIVSYANRRVNESDPIADTRLADGSRVNIVLSPISLDGPAVTIRRFPTHDLTMEDLISFGSISKEAAIFLRELVVNKYNIFICGGTGSGKTTFLNILTNYIPSDERIITIEDSAELRIHSIPNIVRLESRLPNSEGSNEISLRYLIRTALRMRPDRIIVGEVRGEEALSMLECMNTGHEGSISTGHANNAKDMLSRLETMVLMAASLPLPAIRNIIASGIDIIIHLSRMPDKSRKVVEISELVYNEDNNITLNQLFIYDKISGLIATGNKLINDKQRSIINDQKLQ